MQRATVGARLDINMLRYQQAPMVPKGGYTKPQEITIRQGPPKKAAMPRGRSHHPLKYNSPEERMAARNQRTLMDNLARVKRLFAVRKDITKMDAMRILGMNQENSARHLLKRLVKANLLTESGTYRDDMMVFIPYDPDYVKPKNVKKPQPPRSMKREEYDELQRQRGLETNKKRCADTFGKDDVLSTNEIAGRTGLTRPAALNLVKEWVKRDLVVQHNVADKGLKTWRKVK